jgi:hypothetical protein
LLGILTNFLQIIAESILFESDRMPVGKGDIRIDLLHYHTLKLTKM